MDEVKLISSEIKKASKESGRFYDNVLHELTSLNGGTERATARLYDAVLGMLEIHPSTGIPQNSIHNLSLVRKLITGLQPIQDKYRKLYGALARSYREEGLGLIADKEERVGKLFKKLGVEDRRSERGKLSEDSLQMVDMIHRGGLQKVNQILEKWKSYVYGTFNMGIVKGLPLLDLRALFYNKDGSIRVGSSLEQESVYAAMESITQQRTIFLRNQAKESGYTYCWNSNPLDFRTKPECLEATMAGVISEKQMGMEHGFPPRYICRCDVTFTREEWTGVNSSVNRAIDNRRQRLFTEMSNDPSSFQKSKWKVNGKWVYPKDDIQRLQGNKMYQSTAEKLNILADPVPGFDGDDFFDLPGRQFSFDELSDLALSPEAMAEKVYDNIGSSAVVKFWEKGIDMTQYDIQKRFGDIEAWRKLVATPLSEVKGWENGAIWVDIRNVTYKRLRKYDIGRGTLKTKGMKGGKPILKPKPDAPTPILKPKPKPDAPIKTTMPGKMPDPEDIKTKALYEGFNSKEEFETFGKYVNVDELKKSPTIGSKATQEASDVMTPYSFRGVELHADSKKVKLRQLDILNEMKGEFDKFIKANPGSSGIFEALNTNTSLSLDDATHVLGAKSSVRGRHTYYPGVKWKPSKISVATKGRSTTPTLGVGHRSWSVSNDVLSTFRHEYGHHLKNNLRNSSTPQIRALNIRWNDLYASQSESYWTRKVSEYGAGTAEELFADSFSAYTSPLYGTSGRRFLPKEIEEFFDNIFKVNPDAIAAIL